MCVYVCFDESPNDDIMLLLIFFSIFNNVQDFDELRRLQEHYDALDAQELAASGTTDGDTTGGGSGGGGGFILTENEKKKKRLQEEKLLDASREGQSSQSKLLRDYSDRGLREDSGEKAAGLGGEGGNRLAGVGEGPSPLDDYGDEGEGS